MFPLDIHPIPTRDCRKGGEGEEGGKKGCGGAGRRVGMRALSIHRHTYMHKESPSCGPQKCNMMETEQDLSGYLYYLSFLATAVASFAKQEYQY